MRQLQEGEFLRDVSEHQIRVLREEGVVRHLRFAKPGTGDERFDLLTWPGYLCFTGDMGTYVFSRTDDMFDFFRAGRRAGGGLAINPQYWAEKLEATDKADGHQEFDAAAFKREITVQRRRMFVDNAEGMDLSDRAELWSSLQDVIDAGQESEGRAISSVQDWSLLYRVLHTGEKKTLFINTDDFPRCKTYTRRFLWCCYAVAWGVRQYDERARHVQEELDRQVERPQARERHA
jgi:hypothetical protein